MTKEQKEQNNVLAKEIESWSNFEYALREDRILFNRMLKKGGKIS